MIVQSLSPEKRQGANRNQGFLCSKLSLKRLVPGYSKRRNLFDCAREKTFFDRAMFREDGTTNCSTKVGNVDFCDCSEVLFHAGSEQVLGGSLAPRQPPRRYQRQSPVRPGFVVSGSILFPTREWPAPAGHDGLPHPPPRCRAHTGPPQGSIFRRASVASPARRQG